MESQNFSPWAAKPTPCWHCEKFVRLVYGGSAAECGHARAARIRSQPENGCSAFTREPGADDEPGPPPIQEWVMRAAPAGAST